MFIDRLLGEWDDFVIRTSTAKLEFKLAFANWSDLKSLLKESVIFDCDNISDYLGDKSLDGKKLSFPNVRLCFDNIWLEWKPYIPNEDDMIRVSKEGYLISSYEREDHLEVYAHSFWEGTVDNRPVSSNYFGTTGWTCNYEGSLTGVISKSVEHYSNVINSGNEEEDMIVIMRSA